MKLIFAFQFVSNVLILGFRSLKQLFVPVFSVFVLSNLMTIVIGHLVFLFKASLGVTLEFVLTFLLTIWPLALTTVVAWQWFESASIDFRAAWTRVWTTTFSLVLASLLYFLVTATGFLFVILPGIFFGGIFVFAFYFLLLEPSLCVSPFKLSWRLVKNRILETFVLALIMLIPSIAVVLLKREFLINAGWLGEAVFLTISAALSSYYIVVYILFYRALRVENKAILSTTSRVIKRPVLFPFDWKLAIIAVSILVAFNFAIKIEPIKKLFELQKQFARQLFTLNKEI